ncbi:MAG: Delta(1)-pyrroline-2-carboxylate reductase [Acidimicrobiaceae bacterium]|nr:Delta(1)-pyrroline-2-carboxylate reductase [Acidimicrobiaceae bacterium]
MAQITVLVESEVRNLVGLGTGELDVIEAVYPAISAGAASMPPIQRIDVPEHNGEIDIKSAYLPGFDGIAVKVSAGFFDNPARGLPSLGGLILVFESDTGLPAAALFDNGYLTNVRTALAGAVAARHLATQGANAVGVLGAGVQARLQVEALTLVRPVANVRVWARRSDEAERLAAELRSDLDVEASAVDAPGDAVCAGGILVTTTPATEPLVTAAMLQPGLHITAVGSDAEHKQEISVDAVEAVDVVVCDSRSQSARLGELRAPGASGREVAAVELGEVITGDAAGRVGDDQVTLCDLTGTGAQDTAIASLVMARARDASIGRRLQA